jgi:heterogeneous nuclear ribonucleoprotein U-like protein 1
MKCNIEIFMATDDSDLNLVIDTTQYFSASPMQGDGFNFMWAGVRTSYGFSKGKVFYEARVNARFDKVITPAPPAPNTPNSGGAIPIDEDIPSVLRLGWSTLDTSLQLGNKKHCFFIHCLINTILVM